MFTLSDTSFYHIFSLICGSDPIASRLFFVKSLNHGEFMDGALVKATSLISTKCVGAKRCLLSL